MISSLEIVGLALIDKVELALDEGLTVLTGETGAGKTMLVEALNLAAGERADSGLVRSGQETASVRLVWRDNGEARAFERLVSTDGRHRCLLDGRQVTAAALAEAGEGLVDLHGQHEHQRLLHQRWHSDYLDRFVGQEAVECRERYRAALERARRSARTLADIESAEKDKERLSERLRYEIDEIASAAATPQEADDLQLKLPMLRHAQQLAEAVWTAHAALEGAAGGASPESSEIASAALDGVRAAICALEPVVEHDIALEQLAERTRSALFDLEDVARCLNAYLDGIDREPRAYERAEQRADVLHRLAQKYGGSVVGALEHLEEARQTLDTLEGGQARRADVAAELERALDELSDMAARLSGLREEAAPRFSAQVQEAARDLAMRHCRFVVDLERLEPPRSAAQLDGAPADGLDRVEFLFSANEGESVRALGRVASGGELSRLMLATKTVLGAADSVQTLVFDEIDAGIGGQAAISVADALRRLAKDHQVLVVTHLAQIAAIADHHLVVSKSVRAGRTMTSVDAVDGEARQAEIARMLAGDADSDVSLTHARELLARRGA